MASLDRIQAAAEILSEALPVTMPERTLELRRRVDEVMRVLNERPASMMPPANDTPRVDPFAPRAAVVHLVRAAGWTFCGYHVTALPKGDIWASTRDRELIVKGTECRDCETAEAAHG